MRGHPVVFVAGVALVASSFVPLWATYRIPGLGLFPPETVHQNAWTAYGLTMQLALGLVIVATVLAGMLATTRAGTPQAVRLVLALSGAATLLLLWQIVTGPEGASNPNGYGIGRGLLLFTGGALAAAMTYGSYVEWRKPAATPPFGDDVLSARDDPTSLGE